MSLINQMLKDLDARHEADARARLHREVRALPAAPAGNRGLRLAIFALALATLLAALAWAWSNHRGGLGPAASEALPTAAAPPASVTAAAPAHGAPAPTDVAVASPAASAATPASPMPSVAPVASAATDTATEAGAGSAADGLRMSAVLERVPATAPTSTLIGEPPATSISPAPRRDPVPAARKTSDLPTAVAASPDAPSHAGRVDKQPASAAPRNPQEQAETDYRRALALMNGARTSEAVDLLLDSLGRDGSHAATRQLLARLLIEQRRSDEAAAILAEGLARQPGQVAWAMTLARLRVDAGDLAAAARVLQAAQAYAGGNADFAGFAGHLQHRLGNHRAAAEQYQNAARLAPGDGRWWLGLGLALEAEQRGGEAREAFLRARASASLNADLTALVEQKLRQAQ